MDNVHQSGRQKLQVLLVALRQHTQFYLQKVILE